MSQKINLRIHRKLSLLAGFSYPMPENYESRSKCFRIFWCLYVYVPYAFMLVELISQAIQISLSIHNVEVLTTCTLSTLYVVQYLLKLGVFRQHEETFNKIFEEMSAISNDLMMNPFRDDNFLKFFDEYYKKVMNIGLLKGALQLACNLGLNILFCVLSWINMKPKITAAFSWTPYDSSKNPNYTLTCLFEMICYGAVTARTGVFDLLFWIMIIIPIVQLNYMKYLMEIMLRDVDTDEAENPEYVDVTNSNTQISEETLSLQLEWWIKIHQRILEMVHDFESLASLFLAVNYIASLIDLFMSGFVAMSSSHWDIFQRVLINVIIMTDAFQLYVVSLAGDWLRESSQNVADYGFTALIFQVKKEFRKHYLYILARTRRLIQIRFGGVNPLSSQTFSRIDDFGINYLRVNELEVGRISDVFTNLLIQLTLTYFVTIIQIKNSQNEKFEQSKIFNEI